MIKPWPTIDSNPVGDFRIFTVRSDEKLSPRVRAETLAFHFGAGGVTARTDSTVVTVLPDRSVQIDNNDTFATITYGGGVKALRVFGPVGLRLNIMGRTMPNFFGRGNTWAEFTAGPVFTWGQK